MYRLLFFFLIFLITCKPAVKKGIEDPSWQEESLKISSELCSIFVKCSEATLQNIPDYMEKQAGEEIAPNNCIEKNKKSNVYNLKVSDPESIKTAYRECAVFIKTLSCNDVTSGMIQQNNFCKIVSLAQMNKN